MEEGFWNLGAENIRNDDSDSLWQDDLKKETIVGEENTPRLWFNMEDWRTMFITEEAESAR
jgi:hypothetical protein